MAAIPYDAREQGTGIEPLPSTKLRPPAMGAPFMARERLIERMRQSTWARLILVQAPAGFGTTTLLRHAYDLFCAAGYAVAWLTLDAGDNDLDRFMACLGQALAQLAQGSSQAAGLQDADPFEQARMLASMSFPFMLFLDEFEHLHNPAGLTVVRQLVDLLGPRQKIVLGSREQPALELGCLRARQQLLEIDASQLRFTLEETTRFLCEKRGLRLDAQDVEHLHGVTGGWAAALWLSSMALENSEDPKHFIRTFSGSNTVVASYLAEAVLSHRSRHLQDFILQTSILRKFCADSCNAVTGRSDSARTLQEIERSNMFMTAVDEQRTWFSYHPLFAGFLRAQLERQYPGLAPTLHRRASIWYARQKRPAHAIDHALAAGDMQLTLHLLDEHAEPLFLQGRVRMLARWFDAIERQTLAEHPKLMTVYAWSLIHINRSEEALALLDGSRDAGTSPISQPEYLVLKTLSLAMLDRIEQTAPFWDAPHVLGSAVQEPLLRSMLMIGGAYYYAIAGRYAEARRLLDLATHEHPAVGPLFSVTVAGYVHGMIDLMQGHLRAACARFRTLIGDERQARMYISGGTEAGWSGKRGSADSGFASVYLAEALYEADELEEAGRLLSLYLPLVKDAGIPDQLVASHVLHARILRVQGNSNEALHILLELEQLGIQRRLPRIVDSARLEQARCALLDGDAEGARTLLTLVGIAPAWQSNGLQMVSNDIETPFLAWARWQLHNGQATAVVAPLKEHLHEAHARGRMRYALRVKVLYALALLHAGQRNPALRTIRDAMQDAHAEGFIRIFKDEGPALQQLVRDMLMAQGDLAFPENMALRHFADKLIERGDDTAPHQMESITRGTPVIDVPPDSELTARELEVLALLAQGHGNQAIAEKLFVSVTTVKTHLRNINLKLGAHNRTEAISIARRLAIISH